MLLLAELDQKCFISLVQQREACTSSERLAAACTLTDGNILQSSMNRLQLADPEYYENHYERKISTSSTCMHPAHTVPPRQGSAARRHGCSSKVQVPRDRVSLDWTTEELGGKERREREDGCVSIIYAQQLSFFFPSCFCLLSSSIPSPFFLLLPLSQNHIDVCVYRAVTCPNKECEAVLPYHQLESHEQNCSFRRVTCEHCHTEITISQLEVRKRRFQLECTRFSWIRQKMFFPM